MRTLSPVQSSFNTFKTESEWKAMEADNAKNWADDKDSFLKDDASSLRRINQAVTNNVATSENSEESLIRTSKKFSDDNELDNVPNHNYVGDGNYRRQGHHIATRRPHNYYTPEEAGSSTPRKQQRTGRTPIIPGRGWYPNYSPAPQELTENEYDELMANLDSQQMDVVDFGEGQGYGAPAQGGSPFGSRHMNIQLLKFHDILFISL
ncbi:hypothetical protein Trydic_g17328 [Trypoxylus dichotomus]